MELILADQNGFEIRRIWEDVDFDIGGTNDFQISIPYSAYQTDLTYGARVYVPGTEYGGIVQEIAGETENDLIFARGYTWRGYLEKRIIQPPAGADYRIVSGELNAVIAAVIDGSLGNVFAASTENTGVSVSNFQFYRYETALSGLQRMLSSVSYRLNFSYVQTQSTGYVEVSARPAENYGGDVEISQDMQVQFSSTESRRGVNHLICLGIGELKDRTVVHLYADAAGQISQTQSIFGIDEIQEVFDDSNAELDDLIANGTRRLREVMNFREFAATLGDIGAVDYNVGDTLSGRDYITGTSVTKPISGKIVRITGGILSIEYTIEGED